MFAVVGQFLVVASWFQIPFPSLLGKSIDAFDVSTHFFLDSEQRVYDPRLSPTVISLVLLLSLLQFVTRLYECCFVSVFSNATMSLVHYLFGLFVYVAVLLSENHIKLSVQLPEQRSG